MQNPVDEPMGAIVYAVGRCHGNTQDVGNEPVLEFATIFETVDPAAPVRAGSPTAMHIAG